jgi:hypothetical protein
MYDMKHDKKSKSNAHKSHEHGVKLSNTGSLEHKEHHPGGDEYCHHRYAAGSAGKLDIYLKNKG